MKWRRTGSCCKHSLKHLHTVLYIITLLRHHDFARCLMRKLKFILMSKGLKCLLIITAHRARQPKIRAVSVDVSKQKAQRVLFALELRERTWTRRFVILPNHLRQGCLYSSLSCYYANNIHEVCVNLLQMIRSIDRLSDKKTFPQQWNLKHRSYLMMISFFIIWLVTFEGKSYSKIIVYIDLD